MAGESYKQEYRCLDNEQFHKLQNRYAQELEKTKQVLLCAQLGEPINEALVAGIAQDLYEDSRRYLSVIHLIDYLLPQNYPSKEKLDTMYQLSMHSIHTAIYSLAIGNWTRLSQQQCIALIKAALLHDVGKTGLKPELLNKPGKLDHKEYRAVKKHSNIGYEIACQAGFLDEVICDSILMHHERIDGKGYPRGLCEKDILDFAKIIAIADAFDAVSSDHVYKSRMLPFDALRVLENMKENKLESWRTSEFIRNLTNYYMGSPVLLNNGAVGEIVFISPTALKEPIVCVGGKLIDLSQNKNVHVVRLMNGKLASSADYFGFGS